MPSRSTRIFLNISNGFRRAPVADDDIQRNFISRSYFKMSKIIDEIFGMDNFQDLYFILSVIVMVFILFFIYQISHSKKPKKGSKIFKYHKMIKIVLSVYISKILFLVSLALIRSLIHKDYLFDFDSFTALPFILVLEAITVCCFSYLVNQSYNSLKQRNVQSIQNSFFSPIFTILISLAIICVSVEKVNFLSNFVLIFIAISLIYDAITAWRAVEKTITAYDSMSISFSSLDIDIQVVK
jgi:hypothetical protein